MSDKPIKVNKTVAQPEIQPTETSTEASTRPELNESQQPPPPDVPIEQDSPELPLESTTDTSEPGLEVSPEQSITEFDTYEQEDVEVPISMFQAVGIIVGEVDLNESGANTVTINRYKYQLSYKRLQSIQALKKEIENTGERTQRLIVYPKAIHFPRKEQPHQIAFQLVGFDKGREPPPVISTELGNNEFKLSGLWQFIPVCSTPCISVFRNFTPERLEYIKQALPAKKVRFMKASHLPLLWKDSPVRPFRYNPRLGKEQGRPAFVTLKAKFIPGRNVFGFEALLAPPQETAPKFLKASKEEKATVQQEARKNKPPAQTFKKDDEKQSQPLPKPVRQKPTQES